MWALTIAVLLLLISSAICSCTEAAIFSLPIAKAKQLAEKNFNGKLVHRIREEPARYISTIVIGNNVANIVGTYFVAYLATNILTGNMLASFPFLLTVMVIIFSEIFPKTIGERFPVFVTYWTARPLAITTWVMTPVVWGIEKVTCFFLGHRPRQITSENEIKALARIGHQEGVIDADESRMIGKVFELDDRTAEDIMTPRTAITWIRSFEPVGAVTEKVNESQHSRLLVVGETIDDVKGIFLKSQMLQLLVEGHDENAMIEDFMEAVDLFPEATPADDLLEYFKKSRVHLVVVVDEYGGVSGVVTLEDVLEVLTGEIMDETDACEDMREFAKKNSVKKIAASNQGNKSNFRLVR